MTTSLATTVERFASAIAPLDERALETALPEPSDPDPRWPSYADYPRDMIFVAYQRLRELAVAFANQRATDTPPSVAQRILGQHQLAYRDLTGALVGIHEEELDVVPAEGEWPLRTVLEHMLWAEFGFSLVIESALEQRGVPATDLNIAQLSAEEAMRRSREMHQFTGDLASFHTSMSEVHGHALRSFSGLSDDDLGLPTLWYDGIVPLHFMLHGLDAHMREHTIQADKTIHSIGHTVTEGERLARLVHHALGECEAALIGAPDAVSALQQNIEAQFAHWDAILASR